MNELVESDEQRIRQILGEHAGLSLDVAALDAGADLYTAGMSSRASVTVMLALEAAFDLEFPDAMLRRDVFASISAISAAIAQIRAGA